ncbi:MAG: hypothetical protein FJ098_16595 [Deltaproteobacteria bacterium]|nr:hypothetical protein [Deltaproteobacteria bacterium]
MKATLLAVLALLAPWSARATECWDAARGAAEAGEWAAVEAALRPRTDRDRLCDLLLAEALVHQGKHTWAIPILQPLLAAEPRDSAARAILGAALMGMGDDDGLLSLGADLPPVPLDDPWWGVLEHQAGVAELRAGRDREARRRLGRLLASRPGHPFRDAAEAYLDLAWETGYRERAALRLDTSAGLQYDSNAAFEPLDGRLSPIQGSPAAWRGWLSAALRVPVYRGPRTTLGVNGAAYRSFHSTPAANDFNYTDFSGGAVLSRRMRWGDADASLEVAWQSRAGFLDGGPLLPEPGFFAFLENHSLAAGFRVEPSGELALALTGVGGYQRYAELARNNLAGGGLLSLLWTPSPVDLSFTASGIRREASGRGYDRYELSSRLTLGVALPWEVRISVSGGAGYDDYTGSAGWFEAGPRRRDTRWEVRGALARPIVRGLGVELQSGWTRRDSNVGTFAWERWTAGLMLTWGYPWD